MTRSTTRCPPAWTREQSLSERPAPETTEVLYTTQTHSLIYRGPTVVQDVAVDKHKRLTDDSAGHQKECMVGVL